MKSSSPSLIEPLEARIAPAATMAAVTALQDQLNVFAAEKDAKQSTPVTAKADDLVYSIFQLTQTSAWNEPAEVNDLLEAALQPAGTKVRADKDKIAPRLVAAALLGSRITDGTDIAGIVAALADVNSALGTKVSLTAAGKEAVVAQALKIVSGGTDADAGQDIGVVMGGLPSSVSGNGSPDSKLQTFTIAVLKQVGTKTDQLLSFMGRVLDEVTGNKQTFAVNVAAGVVATNPAATSAALGAVAKTLASDTDRKDFAFGALGNTKLAKVQSAVAAAIAHEVTGDLTQFAADLLGAFDPAKRPTKLRGAIASGVIQNVSSSDVAGVIDAALAGKTLEAKDLADFTSGAATGTGNLAGDVVARMAALATTISPGDAAVLTKIGQAALKAIAVSAPDAGFAIAEKLIDASGMLFDEDPERTTLAKSLALAVPTSGPVTGAATAGVASKLTSLSEGPIASLGAAAMLKAPKSATDIAKQLAEVFANLSTGTPPNFGSFAASLALFSPNNAPAIAAGVAATAVANSTVTDGQPSGQDAGDIAVAVIKSDFSTHKFEAKAFTIAGTVALVVDVERIADIGNKVAALYDPLTIANLPKLPKISGIGSLATSLAKAINTKPGVSTANRVDELGELAAELTRQAIAALGPNNPKLESTIVTIGTSIMKGLSASLLINGGAFAADLKDAAEDISGAIGQTISVAVGENRITSGKADTMLADTGSIEAALLKAAKKFAAGPSGALDNVRDATGATDRLYVDPTPANNEPVSNANSGGSISGTARYEIGSVVDATDSIFVL